MGYKYSTDIIDHTCPIVDDLTQTCLSLIDDDFHKIGLEGGYDNEIWKLVEKRINTLIGKVKESATEKMREALDTLVKEVNDLEDQLEDSQKESSYWEDKFHNEQDEISYWKEQYETVLENQED